MANPEPDPLELTYPLRTAARLTGLSPELLRAWERRYGVVRPLRTPGGTRRYRAADLEKLRLLKAAVDAGNRIGTIAELDDAELKRRASGRTDRSPGHLDEVLATLERLESNETQALLALQFSALGATRFAREFALPLIEEVGERWARGEMGIAQEHMLTAHLRTLLGAALHPTATSLLGPKVVFGTPIGEPHELGLLMAALTGLGAGVDPLYLGTELPADELASAVRNTGAAALALSIVTMDRVEAQAIVEHLRSALPANVFLWLGGSGSRELTPVRGTEVVPELEDFEQRVTLLGMSRAANPRS